MSANQGHAFDVEGVAVTSNGRFVISVSADRTLKVWDLSGQSVRTLESQINRVFDVPVLIAASTFTILLWVLFFVIFAIVGLPWSIKVLVVGLVRLVYDQGKFAFLSIRSDARPQSGAEAIRVLHSFKSDVIKAQYARALLRWLPVGTDVQVLVTEANQHKGAIRDALFQLIEVWQDSKPGTAQRSGG